LDKPYTVSVVRDIRDVYSGYFSTSDVKFWNSAYASRSVSRWLL